LPQYQP
jgi:hypothetical protein